MKVGISQIGIAIPEHFISIEELAKKRNIQPEYGLDGLGVFQARIPYQISIEDLAVKALKEINFENIERFYIGTESDSDASKPISIKILNQKLGLKIVPFQYKFACLAGLEALVSACEYSPSHQGKPAVVLAVDRSIYRETEPRAEMTQGCAAVALRIEKNPKILILNYQNLGQYAADIDDFFIPPDSFPFPIVNGDLTKPAYLECQKQALEDWKEKNRQFLKRKSVIEVFDYFIMHTPFPKIVEWTAALFWRHEKERSREHPTLAQCLENPSLFKEYKKDLDRVRELPEFQKFFLQKIKPGLKYNLFIGNSYTSSIFVSLISVLERAKEGQKIGLGGYGSGAGAICLEGIVKKSFKSNLASQIKNGKKINIEEYEEWRKKQFSNIGSGRIS